MVGQLQIANIHVTGVPDRRVGTRKKKLKIYRDKEKN